MKSDSSERVLTTAASQDNELFQYQKLRHRDSIRLLKITNTKHLDITIEEFRLKEAGLPFYAALSYVWGDGVDRTTIQCNGKNLGITRTLDEALRHVAPHNTLDWLWVDQICINQNDLEERAAQVKHMSMIYTVCNDVFAWLGLGNENTTLGLEKIAEVAQGARTLEEEDEDVFSTFERHGPEQAAKVGIKWVDPDKWFAMADIFDRPWFTRAWTVQEILPTQGRSYPPKYAALVIGDQTVDWFSLKLAAAWVGCKGDGLQLEGYMSINGIAQTMKLGIAWTSKFGRQYQSRHRPIQAWSFPSMTLLTTFRDRFASDPRDKVYATIGLSSIESHDGLEDLERSTVLIDYSLPILDLYRDTAMAVILDRPPLNQDKYGLDIIMEAVPRSTEPGWPTWVPDWRITDLSDAGHQRLPSFKPTGDLPVKVSASPTNTLCVPGMLLGRINYAHNVRHADEFLFNNDVRSTLQYIISQLGPIYRPTNETTATAFTMTLLVGQWPWASQSFPLSPTKDSIADLLLDYLDARNLPNDSEPEKQHKRELLQDLDRRGINSWIVSTYFGALCERRLFVTETGLLGLGNYHMQAGDVVAVLCGMHGACILRPRGQNEHDGYELVGDAYVHGVMNGELFVGLTEKDYPVDEDKGSAEQVAKNDANPSEAAEPLSHVDVGTIRLGSNDDAAPYPAVSREGVQLMTALGFKPQIRKILLY